MAHIDLPKSLRLLAGAALTAALALPAAAAADTTITGGPLKVRDYEMTVIGTDAAQDSLTVMFNRRGGSGSQMHMYSFAAGVTVTPTSIKGSLGRFGAIDLKLTGARSGKGSIPAGCTGNPGTTKNGTLAGSFKLVADSSYFRTVTAKKLKGMTMAGGKLDCQAAGGRQGHGGQPGSGPAQLSQFTSEGAAMTSFTASRESQSVMRMEDPAATAPATVMHLISAEGAGLDAAGDLATATVPALGPFIGGSGRYEGTAFPGGSSGELSGSLVAKFDSIGDLALTGDATITG